MGVNRSKSKHGVKLMINNNGSLLYSLCFDNGTEFLSSIYH